MSKGNCKKDEKLQGFEGFKPSFLDEAVPHSGGMHAVSQPIGGGGLIGKGVKACLQLDEGKVILFCHSLCRRGVGSHKAVKALPDGWILGIEGGRTLQNKGLHEHDLDVGKCFLDLLDEHTVDLFKLFGGNAVVPAKLM